MDRTLTSGSTLMAKRLNGSDTIHVSISRMDLERKETRFRFGVVMDTTPISDGPLPRLRNTTAQTRSIVMRMVRLVVSTRRPMLRETMTDLVLGNPIASSSPSASASAAPAPSATDAPEEVDYDNLPICDSGDDTSDDDSQTQETQETYVRRGRGQHWQRSVDSEFQKLDRSYIPHAPNVERRSRRRNAIVTPTSTGL